MVAVLSPRAYPRGFDVKHRVREGVGSALGGFGAPPLALARPARPAVPRLAFEALLDQRRQLDLGLRRPMTEHAQPRSARARLLREPAVEQSDRPTRARPGRRGSPAVRSPRRRPAQPPSRRRRRPAATRAGAPPAPRPAHGRARTRGPLPAPRGRRRPAPAATRGRTCRRRLRRPPSRRSRWRVPRRCRRGQAAAASGRPVPRPSVGRASSAPRPASRNGPYGTGRSGFIGRGKSPRRSLALGWICAIQLHKLIVD